MQPVERELFEYDIEDLLESRKDGVFRSLEPVVRSNQPLFYDLEGQHCQKYAAGGKEVVGSFCICHLETSSTLLSAYPTMQVHESQ